MSIWNDHIIRTSRNLSVPCCQPNRMSNYHNYGTPETIIICPTKDADMVTKLNTAHLFAVILICMKYVSKEWSKVLSGLLVSVYFLVFNLLDVLRPGNGRLEESGITQYENRNLNEYIVTSDRVYKGVLTNKNLENIQPLGVNQCHRQRFVVYKCDSSSRCGGWGDRQKGIVTSFLLSLLTNRTFVIDISTPCELTQFFLSNGYNWSVCIDFLKTVPKENVSDLNNNFQGSLKFLTQVQNFNFDKNWTKQVVVLRIRVFAFNGIRRHVHAKTRLKWLLNIANEDVIHLVLHTLFKPNQRILNDLVKLNDFRIKGKHLVCSHIRKGKNPSIPLDNERPRGSSNETVILDFLEKYDNDRKHVIYIASDSDEIKRLAETRLNTYIHMNRTILHVDRLGNMWRFKTETCEGFYTALLEQIILSMCDTLLLTRSGYGAMAAYMRGISDNLFLFHPQTQIILKSNLTDIQGVFRFFENDNLSD